jgi:hypothetical protein
LVILMVPLLAPLPNPHGVETITVDRWNTAHNLL